MTEEIRQEYYPDSDQLWFETSYKNDRKNGIERWLSRNGILQLEIPYSNGQIHGIKKRWRYTGEISIETPYVHGQLHGIQIHWNRNGEPRSFTYYLYGYAVSEEEYRKHELILLVSGVEQ